MKTIDISYGTPQTYTVYYEQYEENFRDIAVRVVDGNGSAYDLSAFSARIAGYKPDAHLVYRTGTIVANCIYFDVSQQMTAVATTTGYALNLVLISADKRETLVTILFKVKAATVQDASIISTDDINVLDNITAAQLAEIHAFIAETYKTSEWAAYKTAAETARDASVDAKTAAESARDTAVTAKTAAESARDTVVTAKTAAESARDTAVTAKTAAETASDAAINSKTAASTSERNAASSATAAEQSATNANTARTDAQAARGAAITARTGAETARDAAVTAKTAAEAARDRTIAEAESIYTIQHAPPMASLYTAIILETPTLGVL